MQERHRVVLYNPRAEHFTMPLALLAVGSALDADRFEIVIVDGRLEAEATDAVVRAADGALCLGVTVLSGEPIRDALEASRAVKVAWPDLPVIWGGWHPSILGADCLVEPCVDAVVVAQGERTLPELCERLTEERTLAGCPGSQTRDGDLQPRPFAQIGTFPAHDYNMIDTERYFERKGKRQLDYVSSQGCLYRCAFCADPAVYGRHWSGLPAERVCAEAEALWRRHRFDDLSFQDESFFTDQRRVEGIVDGFLALGLPFSWAATLRADQGARLPGDLFSAAVASGLRRVIVGVESGSEEVLQRLSKDITLEQVMTCAERCRADGVNAIFPFIVGLPNEPISSVQASLSLARRLRCMSPGFETPIFYYAPYPGSALARSHIDGFETPRSLEQWSRFDFVGGRGPWVRDEVVALVEAFDRGASVSRR